MPSSSRRMASITCSASPFASKVRKLSPLSVTAAPGMAPVARLPLLSSQRIESLKSSPGSTIEGATAVTPSVPVPTISKAGQRGVRKLPEPSKSM